MVKIDSGCCRHSRKNVPFQRERYTELSKLSNLGGKQYWSLYIDEYKLGDNVDLGTVLRVGPVSISGPLNFTLCDNTNSTVKLDEVEDLIAPLGGRFSDGCPSS